jgi:acyl-CoA synthetase (NDP forming)
MENVISEAVASGRDVLLEHELLDALQALGVSTPARCFFAASRGFGPEVFGAVLGEGLLGQAAVLKVVSPAILHKSDLGGVTFLKEATVENVAEAAAAMLVGLPSELKGGVLGLLLEKAVDFQSRLGHELLLGMRQSADFGPVYTIGFGGTYVEAMAAATKADQSTVLFCPAVTSRSQLRDKLAKALFFRWATGQVRGVAATQDKDALIATIDRLIAALEAIREQVEAQSGRQVAELELNPIVFDQADKAWKPVDALLRLGPPIAKPRALPLASLKAGLSPARVALIGVSQKINMGRIILRSVLDAGFDPTNITVIRESTEQIDGVRCVANVAALEHVVDLLVVAVPASAVVDVLSQVYASTKVRSVLLIPGGMGETEAGKSIAEAVEALLDENAADEQRAVLIGNNSVGLVCQPSRFDSLFIPKDKLPREALGNGKRTAEAGNVALISQSGAFMLTQLSKLSFLSPAYQLSVGNQIDARVSDFVRALADDESLQTYALYIEGLKPRDGEALAGAVRALKAAGKDAVVYKAGRSSLGQAATMGHTASVAGDFRIFADVLRDAGAIVVESLDDFVELLSLSSLLGKKRVSGNRVALMSNAGYEVVSMADSHRGSGYRLDAATFADSTREAISAALKQARIDSLVNVQNPLDLTPMANDDVHIACIEAMLVDDGVDLAVFGMVPYTPAVQTLAHGISERDVFDSDKGYATRLIALAERSDKPFVVVVDAGVDYDPLCAYLQSGGIPTFRTADRAVRALGTYVCAKS